MSVNTCIHIIFMLKYKYAMLYIMQICTIPIIICILIIMCGIFISHLLLLVHRVSDGAYLL